MTATSQFRLAVFDLAGTTVVDHGEVPAAFRQTLYSRGIELTPQQLLNIRGASKKEAIRNIMLENGRDEISIASTYAEFLLRLAKLFQQNGIAEIPGTSAAFEFLQAQGIKVALNTGFDRSIVSLLLSGLPWDQRKLAAIISGDDVEHGRPAPDMIQLAMQRCSIENPREVIVIGDTVLDMQAGANAAAGLNIAVLSGAHTKEQLQTSPYHLMIDGIAAIPEQFASF